MKLLVTCLAAISLSGLLSPLIHPSNSEKLSEEGLERFYAEEYQESVQSFEDAREIQTSAESTFDLGTALVATEEHQRGEEILTSLVGDETFAPASWYNIGNSQLARGALDEAIDSYVKTLRMQPSNMAAKRNLEIALKRRQEQQQRQQSQGSGGEQDPPEPEQQTPERQENESDQLDPDLEQVLRSIDQQEREELSRMRRANAIRRPTDW